MPPDILILPGVMTIFRLKSQILETLPVVGYTGHSVTSITGYGPLGRSLWLVHVRGNKGEGREGRWGGGEKREENDMLNHGGPYCCV